VFDPLPSYTISAMSIEVEIKLAVAPHVLRDASRLPWLRKLAAGPVDRKRLVSVYFDTPKFKLRNNGLTLRIRHDGPRLLQTIKATANGISDRNEWEEEVGRAKPDFTRARQTALAPLVTKKLRRRVRPIFETDVQRTVIPVHIGDSELEVAFDRGRIKTGGDHEEISEIEFELKKGKRADLVRLARRLGSSLPVTFGTRAKPERGYALSAGELGKPVEAAAINLDSKASAGGAFLATAQSCLHHLAANRDAVRQGDPEGVHQMRVGLRRLRAAISVFKEVVQGTATEKVKAELRWLAKQLAPARDFDVMVKESVAPLREASPDKAEIKVLEADLKERRAKGLKRARAAVEGDRYRAVLLTTALWLANGDCLKTADPQVAARRDRKAKALARDVLTSRTKTVAKKIARLEGMDPRARHRLRISVKKLRYATDFFASLFAKSGQKKGRKRFEKLLKELQDALGTLNDIVVHEKLAGQLIRSPRRGGKRPEKAFAMGVLTGREQRQAQACISAALKAGRSFSKAPRFWR
jgi:inorganic triphosphatase YgiF